MRKTISLKDRILKSRLVTDSFWALLGNVIAKGLALAAGIIVARFLGKETFGEYGIIRNTLVSIAMFSTFGLGYTATKYVAEYKEKKKEYIRIIFRYSQNITLVVSGLMAIGLFITANYVAKEILEAPHLKTPLRFIAIWIVFNAITTTQIGILSGFGDFKGMARINTIVGISTFITSVIFTYYWQLNGALLALLISQIINWLLNYLLVKQYIPDKYKPDLNETILLKEILKFSLPVALQEAVFSLGSWALSLVIIKLSSYGELGLYSAAMQWYAIILFIPAMLRNVILSHLSEVQNDNKKHNRVIKITLAFNFIVTFIPFVIIYFFSNFIEGIYGLSFDGLKNIINIAVFATIFTSLSNVYTQAYLSQNKNWIMLGIRCFRDFGKIVVAFYLINKNNGINGAEYAAMSILLVNGIFFFIIVLVYHLHIARTNNNQTIPVPLKQ